MSILQLLAMPQPTPPALRSWRAPGGAGYHEGDEGSGRAGVCPAATGLRSRCHLRRQFSVHRKIIPDTWSVICNCVGMSTDERLNDAVRSPLAWQWLDVFFLLCFVLLLF